MSKIHRSRFSRVSSFIIKSSSARAGKRTIIENRTFHMSHMEPVIFIITLRRPRNFHLSFFLYSPSTPPHHNPQSSTSLNISVIPFLLNLFSCLCPQRMPSIIFWQSATGLMAITFSQSTNTHTHTNSYRHSCQTF